jgi:hypothetical protein
VFFRDWSIGPVSLWSSRLQEKEKTLEEAFWVWMAAALKTIPPFSPHIQVAAEWTMRKKRRRGKEVWKPTVPQIPTSCPLRLKDAAPQMVRLCQPPPGSTQAHCPESAAGHGQACSCVPEGSSLPLRYEPFCWPLVPGLSKTMSQLIAPQPLWTASSLKMA